MIIIFKKINKLLIIFLLISLVSIPISANAYSNKVVLGGDSIGINVNSKGVLIVGFYDVDGRSPGLDAGLKKGDLLLKVDDTDISKISDLSKKISNSKSLKITYKRNNKIKTTKLKLINDKTVYKSGLYIKDNISGIGTLTFIDPFSKRFGALGHEIIDSNTNKKFELKDGKIFYSEVTSIEKSNNNDIGEKNASFDKNKVFGNIDKNDRTGIYGNYSKKIKNNDLIDISSEAEKGSAFIKTVIKGNKKENFKINILKIDDSTKTRNILFEVIDKRLLKSGNGIVGGMSGSPIVQNDKLIGAVTHAFVDDPSKGYGILIENMLKESEEGS